MRQNKLWFATSRMIAFLTLFLMLPVGATAASKIKVLYPFQGSPDRDGASPVARLIFDEAGNLYGTTSQGGITGDCRLLFGTGCGLVFELTPNIDGTWAEHVLYRFTGGTDGANPFAGLIFDAAGNLHGTTLAGGDLDVCEYGCGVVFQLTPNSDGTWAEHVLHSFSGSDGIFPFAGLIFDASGNLYGTTRYSVFKLTPNSDGTWTEQTLYNFSSEDNGIFAQAEVVFDKAGNLYGTTAGGGRFANCNNVTYGRHCGTVFELTPNADGTWTEKVLYSFKGGKDGANPVAGLIFDAAGNLYGTTDKGGNLNCVGFGCGVVFKLTPNSNGSWTEKVIHTFEDNPAGYPLAGLIFDHAGDLFGTTSSPGTVFKLAPVSGGGWAYSVVHAFMGKPAGAPVAGLVLDEGGNLYGTSSTCGHKCQGLVFEITP